MSVLVKMTHLNTFNRDDLLRTPALCLFIWEISYQLLGAVGIVSKMIIRGTICWSSEKYRVVMCLQCSLFPSSTFCVLTHTRCVCLFPSMCFAISSFNFWALAYVLWLWPFYSIQFFYRCNNSLFLKFHSCIWMIYFLWVSIVLFFLLYPYLILLLCACGFHYTSW